MYRPARCSHYFHHDLNLIVIDNRLKIMDNLFLYWILRKIPQIKHILDIQLIADPLVDPGAFVFTTSTTPEPTVRIP